MSDTYVAMWRIYQEKYLADDKYAPFGTSYSTEVLLENDT